jgi:hypothetical protein
MVDILVLKARRPWWRRPPYIWPPCSKQGGLTEGEGSVQLNYLFTSNEVLLKGKAQYGWPPSSQSREVLLNGNAQYIWPPCSKLGGLNEREGLVHLNSLFKAGRPYRTGRLSTVDLLVLKAMRSYWTGRLSIWPSCSKQEGPSEWEGSVWLISLVSNQGGLNEGKGYGTFELLVQSTEVLLNWNVHYSWPHFFDTRMSYWRGSLSTIDLLALKVRLRTVDPLVKTTEFLLKGKSQ